MLIVDIERIHGNEENILEIFSSDSQEAVVSCLSLHWVNDLPGQSNRCFEKIGFSIELFKALLYKYEKLCNPTVFSWERCSAAIPCSSYGNIYIIFVSQKD